MDAIGRWLPIEQADKTITDVQDFPEVGMTLRNSDTYWVRDEDGRVYEAAWSEGKYGRDYWWDWEAESPVDPVEFMPHPLDPRYLSSISDDIAEVPDGEAMRVIDPDQWEPCSPDWLSRGGDCASAPRVWNQADKNHWHPKIPALNESREGE